MFLNSTLLNFVSISNVLIQLLEELAVLGSFSPRCKLEWLLSSCAVRDLISVGDGLLKDKAIFFNRQKRPDSQKLREGNSLWSLVVALAFYA